MIILMVSCEKIVHLDLNSAEPRIVIEGNITSDPPPYKVEIRTSGDYYTAEGISPISGALVVVSDELGKIDTLREDSAGRYITNNIVGESNMKYSLNVVYQNKEYAGSDFLPNKVYIDSLEFEKRENGNHGPPSENEKPKYYIYCYFTDPSETEDYYRFNIEVNGILSTGAFSNYSLASDQLFNGQHVKYTLYGVEAMPGDTVTIGLNSIGFNTYEYFRTLNDALSSGGMGSTPYNPISNLSNDALGYFGAYTNNNSSIILVE